MEIAQQICDRRRLDALSTSPSGRLHRTLRAPAVQELALVIAGTFAGVIAVVRTAGSQLVYQQLAIGVGAEHL